MVIISNQFSRTKKIKTIISGCPLNNEPLINPGKQVSFVSSIFYIFKYSLVKPRESTTRTKWSSSPLIQWVQPLPSFSPFCTHTNLSPSQVVFGIKWTKEKTHCLCIQIWVPSQNNKSVYRIMNIVCDVSYYWIHYAHLVKY